jgi:hypothetical protein
MHFGDTEDGADLRVFLDWTFFSRMTRFLVTLPMKNYFYQSRI